VMPSTASKVAIPSTVLPVPGDTCFRRGRGLSRFLPERPPHAGSGTGSQVELLQAAQVEHAAGGGMQPGQVGRSLDAQADGFGNRENPASVRTRLPNGVDRGLVLLAHCRLIHRAHTAANFPAPPESGRGALGGFVK
jgi:hypothetical protein